MKYHLFPFFVLVAILAFWTGVFLNNYGKKEVVIEKSSAVICEEFDCLKKDAGGIIINTCNFPCTLSGVSITEDDNYVYFNLK